MLCLKFYSERNLSIYLSINVYVPLIFLYKKPDKLSLVLSQKGNERWNELDAPEGNLYPWDETSTYIKNPPFFQEMVGLPFMFYSQINLYLTVHLHFFHVSAVLHCAKASA